jgi:hypothetical protein
MLVRSKLLNDTKYNFIDNFLLSAKINACGNKINNHTGYIMSCQALPGNNKKCPKAKPV